MLIIANNINQELNLSLSQLNKTEPKKKSFYEKNHVICHVHKGPILSLLLKNRERKNSLKTTDTNIEPFSLDYDFKEIKRFDELNNSLSDISELDLEKENNENKSEFNSSQENNSQSDDETIVIKDKRKFNCREFDFEYEKELHKDYEEIIKYLKFGEK